MRRAATPFSFVSALLFLFADPVAGQVPSIETQIDTAVINVGDPITLLVSVDHAPESQVAWPDSLDLSPFEILDAKASTPISRGGLTRSTLTLTLTAFKLGELDLPGFRVAVVGTQGDSTFLDSNPFGVRVESVGLDESGDIRELKGPMGIPLSLGKLVLSCLVGMAALALAWFLIRRLRREEEKAPGGPGPVPQYRPPHEVALEALAELAASPLLEQGKVKEYHIRASDILRSYVEGRFHVPALEITTQDILRGLEGARVEMSVRQEFQSFLDRCDMVKFAKHRPDEAASRAVLELARRLVEATMQAAPPRAEVEDAPEEDAEAS